MVHLCPRSGALCSLLRRRSLYPTELRAHIKKCVVVFYLIIGIRFLPYTDIFHILNHGVGNDVIFIFILILRKIAYRFFLRFRDFQKLRFRRFLRHFFLLCSLRQDPKKSFPKSLPRPLRYLLLQRDSLF